MRFSVAVLFVVTFACFLPVCHSQELTAEQMGPWSALEKQIKLAVAKDYEKEKEYIHPKAILGGDRIPSPVTATRFEAYNQAFWNNSDPVVSYVLIPVTVTVVDDVAIINAYGKVLTKKDDEVKEITFRLHNTWKKEEGRWKLLGTYNAVLESDED